MKKVLLKDIAKRLNVSIPLVSYVLNGKAEQARVSEEMAKKIKAIAAEMRYTPNQIAKSLKSGKTNTIGLIVADISNPFFSQLARIIEDEAAKFGYIVVFGSSDENAAKSAKLLDVLINHQVDAIIIAPVEDTSNQLIALYDKGIPVVMVDRCLALEIDSIGLNNEQAAFIATKYSFENGCSTIGMIAYETSLPHMKARIKGFKKAIRGRQIAVNKKWIQTVAFNSKTSLEKALDILLFGEQSVDAVFFATNTLAAEGLKRLKQIQNKLKKYPTVIAFDQSDMYDVLDKPPVFVKQPLEEMGKMAVQLAIERIKKPAKKINHVMLNATLVENHTSE